MKLKLTSLVATIVLVTGCSSTSTEQNTTAQTTLTPAEKLQTIIHDSWQYRLHHQPLFASSIGQASAAQKQQLPDLSAAALAAQNKQYQSWLTTLQTIDKTQLNAQQQINLALLEYQFANITDSYRFKEYLQPLTSEGGFYSYLTWLPAQQSFKTEQDYTDYAHRLAAIPDYFQQEISWMKEGIKEGYTLPKPVMKGLDDAIASYIKRDPTKSAFYKPYESLPASLDPITRQQLQAQGKRLIRTQVIPAYQQLLTFMQEQYIPSARTTVGARALPNGLAYYQNRVQHFTTLDMSVAEIHKLGLKEVARIHQQMQQVMAKTGYKGSFADFLHFLRTDPQFYAKTPDELLKDAAWLAKTIDAKLPEYFGKLPRLTYGVAPVPAAIAPKYTSARYAGPSGPHQPGWFWVNTYALDKRPLYELPSLALHEAVPGHHLQTALAAEMENVPEFRKNIYLSVFGEGWALYAEYLGEEMGIYQTPYDEFGRLSMEMWRACRLVVDTGIHAMGWSRQQAIDYMAKNTALSMHNVETEVDRYIGWPGQALAYKMGELTIKELRQEAQSTLGAQFNLREFHDQVLKNGSVTLPLLKQQIHQYIKQKSAAAQTATDAESTTD